MADQQVTLANLVQALNNPSSSVSLKSPVGQMDALYEATQKLNSTFRNLERNLKKGEGNASFVTLKESLKSIDENIESAEKLLKKNNEAAIERLKEFAKKKKGLELQEKRSDQDEEELADLTRELAGMLDKDGDISSDVLKYMELEIGASKKLIDDGKRQREDILKKLIEKQTQRANFVKGKVKFEYANLEKEFGADGIKQQTFLEKLTKISRGAVARALQDDEQGRAYLIDQLSRNRDISQLSRENLLQAGLKEGTVTRLMARSAGKAFIGTAFSAKSGSELGFGSGGALNTGLGMIGGPYVELLLAAINRFNEIGKKALELFGATAGRYGYGEGFDQEGARRFLDFQSTARELSAEYAVNLGEVEAAFKGLQEYSGVRTFDQLKKLASATLEISNATGLATSEVTRLGSAYQKNFGYGAQESVSKAGKQLLGLMNSINAGLTSNLLVTNAEMAALVQNLIEGTQGANVTKTLIPFLDNAFDRVKDLGIQSRVVGDLLRNQIMEIKKSGVGLPGALPSFMLAAGGLFTNRLGGAEAGIASQVGRGKFAYEQGQEMARITAGPSREFWSSPKLILRNDLVDLAFKLKGGDLAGLLASQSDAALGQITQRIFELYQIPGAAEAIGVSLSEITEQFSTIARNNPLQFKLLGGDLDRLTALSEYSKAEATLRTGRVGGTGPMATEEQMKAASETKKAMVFQMTPVDRTNQYLERLVGLVDDLVIFIFDLPLFGAGASDEEVLSRRGGLSEEEYKTLAQLTQLPQRDAEQQRQMDLLRGKQNEFRGKSSATVNPVSGKVTTTVEMDNPPYIRSIAADYASGASRSIGQS